MQEKDDFSTLYKKTEKEICILQGEIMNQSKLIYKYIEAHTQTHTKSQTFQILQELYSIFKKEIKLNDALKSSLNNQIMINSKNLKLLSLEQKQKSSFIFDFQTKVGHQISSFDEITHIFNHQQQKIRDQNVLIAQLHKKIDDLMLEQKKIHAAKAMEIAFLNSKLDSSSEAKRKQIQVKGHNFPADQNVQNASINPLYDLPKCSSPLQKGKKIYSQEPINHQILQLEEKIAVQEKENQKLKDTVIKLQNEISELKKFKANESELNQNSFSQTSSSIKGKRSFEEPLSKNSEIPLSDSSAEFRKEIEQFQSQIAEIKGELLKDLP